MTPLEFLAILQVDAVGANLSFLVEEGDLSAEDPYRIKRRDRSVEFVHQGHDLVLRFLYGRSVLFTADFPIETGSLSEALDLVVSHLRGN